MRFILLLIFSVYFSVSNAETLVFGVYASDKASTVYQKFSPTIKYLSKDLSRRLKRNIRVKLKIFKSYQQAQQAIIRGDIDFARFGPASYITVKNKNPAIQLLLMENKKGKKQFKGVIAVQQNSAIQNLSDLKNKRFAFGDKLSTIGHFLAKAELIKANINAKDLDKYNFLRRHDKVFKAIAKGDYDAGSLKQSTFKKLNKNNQLRVIHEFYNVTKPWLSRAHLKAELFQAIKQSLLALDNKRILKLLKVNGFFETKDKMYNTVRDSMKVSLGF